MARSAFDPKTLFLLLVGVAGCGSQAAPLYPLAEKPAPPPELGAQFDAKSTGSIRGRVVWSGAWPEAHSFRDAGILPGSFADSYDARNRLVPRIDDRGKGIAGAVVYLRKVDPERSRPWYLAPVRIEMKGGSIDVVQDGAHLAGFVHAGDPIEMVSLGQEIESLRARGAVFFTLPFPKPNKPLQRTLDQSGLVELSSAVGNFWARGWLFVVEHPYYVQTDESGGFVLENVPDGTYELVCWLPDWRVERFERDPEIFAVARVWYRKPMEKSMAVRVVREQATGVEFTVGLGDFGK